MVVIGGGDDIVADLIVKDVNGTSIFNPIPITRSEKQSEFGCGLHYLKKFIVLNSGNVKFRVFNGKSESYNQKVSNDSGYIHMTTHT